MGAPKLAVWPFILIALVLSILVWLLSLELGWWSWAPIWHPILSATLSLLSGSVMGWFGWLYWRRRLANMPSEQQQQMQQKLQYQQKLVTENFNTAWQRTQQLDGRGAYQIPWYLLLNDHLNMDTALLRQMGFELIVSEDDPSSAQNPPISFWMSEFAVVVGIHCEADPKQFKPCLHTLFKLLKSKRPRQSANGLMLCLRVSQLLNQGQEQLDLTAKKHRLLIREINQAMGLNLPIYSVFTEMAELMDYCECFSTFDDQRLEEAFGAMMPIAAKPGFDADWFEQSFAKLKQSLTDQISGSLKAQLNPEFRQSILVAPYQFSLLKTELEAYFRRLFLDNQFEDLALNFRGYFFTSASGKGQPIDRLSMALASNLGFSSLPKPEMTSIGRSLFSKQLMRRNIMAEARLVGVNRGRERWYGLLRVAYTGGLCLTFALFIWLLKANFDYYQALDNQAIAQLDRYKQNLLTSKINKDDLTGPIFSLSELRDINLIYSQPRPWYVVSWLPNPAINEAVTAAYQRELEEVLLIALRDYLLKDLYVYNKLEDKVKTAELFNLQQLLYSPDRESNKALTAYYTHFLQEEGQGDVATLERFRELMTDLLKPGVIPPPDNEPLIELVKASLSSEDLSDLLYQHIIQQPDYTKRVDMRSRLGQNYAQVFQFSEELSGYLVPYIFTREGFQELMGSTGFELATAAIKDYEGVVGRVGKVELSRINRNLKQRYVEDYIGYWQRFVSQVQWATPQGWGEIGLQMGVVADPLYSPLKRYYNLISQQTDLASALVLDEPEEEKQKKVKVKGKAGKLVKKAQGPLAEQKAKREQQRLEEQRQSAQKVADAISQPFLQYQHLVKPDDAGQTQLDLAVKQFSLTQDWLKQAGLSNSRGRFFLDQLTEAGAVNSLTQMYGLADSYSDKLLVELLSGTARQLNRLAMNDVRSLINRHWQQDVMGYYSAQIGEFYPFSQDSSLDVSLKAFKAFFGPKGIVDTFGDSFMVYFNVRDSGRPVLNSFLVGQFLALDESFWQALDESSRIQSTFFIADKLGLQFSIRTQVMSQGLAELALYSERPLYSYRNGPSLWKAMSWPINENDSWDIRLRLKGIDTTTAQLDYTGVWSWFRLADAMDGALLQEETTSVLEAKHGQQSAKLLLRVDGDTNPFIDGFFSSLKLPENI